MREKREDSEDGSGEQISLPFSAFLEREEGRLDTELRFKEGAWRLWGQSGFGREFGDFLLAL